MVGVESVVRLESGIDFREYSFFESEKEIVGVDFRGVKFKKVIYFVYGYGRGLKVKGKFKSEWGNRMILKLEDVGFENVKFLGIIYFDFLDVFVRKGVLDGFGVRRNE